GRIREIPHLEIQRKKAIEISRWRSEDRRLRHHLAEVFSQKAEASLRLGEHIKAASEYATATQIVPEKAHYHRKLAQVWANASEPGQRDEYLTRAANSMGEACKLESRNEDTVAIESFRLEQDVVWQYGE